jgi:uncharacterized phiE125 gp8 family phage protein
VQHVEVVSGKKLTSKIVSQTIDGFPPNAGAVILWSGPVTDVLEVKYDDIAGVEQTLALTDFRTVKGANGRLLPLANATSWPSTAYGPGTVRVNYVAGYGPTDRERVSLVQAAILLFGHWNMNREAVMTESRVGNMELPLTVSALIAPYRQLGVA